MHRTNNALNACIYSKSTYTVQICTEFNNLHTYNSRITADSVTTCNRTKNSISTLTGINPIVININWLWQKVYSCLVILKTDSTSYFGCVASFIPVMKSSFVFYIRIAQSYNHISHINTKQYVINIMFTFLLHKISRGCKTGSWTGDLKVQLPSSLAVASVYSFFVPWFHCKDMNLCQFTNIPHKTGQVNNYTRTKSTPIKRYCIAEVYFNYATAIQNTLYVPFITKLTPNILTTYRNTINRSGVDRSCVLQLLDPPFGWLITFKFCTLVLRVCSMWRSYLSTVLTQVCRVWRYCSISFDTPTLYMICGW